MKTEIYPADWKPFKVFPDAPYDVTIHVYDRETRGSTVIIHTHQAGLEQLKELVDNALESLNKTKEMSKSGE